MIRAYWCNIPNVGDRITQYILSKVFNDTVELSETPPRWLISGSVLRWAKPGDILCGIGSFDSDRKLEGDVTAIAVRGPFTARKLSTKVETFGDGGLLLPFFYKPDKERGDKLGIIPHYVDYKHVKENFGLFNVLDVRLPVEQFVDALWECRAVLSSSLHGIVLAEAYGIPAFRAYFNTSVNSYSIEYKHRDYYAGTERDLPCYISVEDFLREQFDLDNTGLSFVRHTQQVLYNKFLEFTQRRA